MEAIRSVEEFLAERGDSLSPEERTNLQGTLSRMKEQYHSLTDTTHSSLAQLDTTISATVQQNTQRVRSSNLIPELASDIKHHQIIFHKTVTIFFVNINYIIFIHALLTFLYKYSNLCIYFNSFNIWQHPII